jgi:hypothetical protein
MPGIVVSRDFKATTRLPDGRDTAYLHLGAEPGFWSPVDEEIAREAERFAESGGRLIILLRPQISRPHSIERAFRKEQKEKAGDEKKGSKTEEKKKPAKPLSGIKARWQFRFDYLDLPDIDGEISGSVIVRNPGNSTLPRTLEWHSAAVITNLPAAWEPVYLRGTNVVMAELRRGKGGIVIGTDSFHASNEALAASPEPRLLAWLTGPCRNIVFDEAHLGSVESAGVARLMRKYRLGGLALAFLLLAILFVWKESARFAPTRSAPQTSAVIMGKSASSGFANLLRRNLPPGDLPRLCLEQWKHAFGRETRNSDKAAAAEVIALHSPDAGKPVGAVALHNELCNILKTRKTHPGK